MADKFDKTKRSDIMAKVKGENTTPELVVRKLLFSMGFRYRLHGKVFCF
jgi:DNA mismatch endonuclease (patch repair protein)